MFRDGREGKSKCSFMFPVFVFPVDMKTNISRLSALCLYATGSWLRSVLVCGLAHLVYHNSGMKAKMLPLS